MKIFFDTIKETMYQNGGSKMKIFVKHISMLMVLGLLVVAMGGCSTHQKNVAGTTLLGTGLGATIGAAAGGGRGAAIGGISGGILGMIAGSAS